MSQRVDREINEVSGRWQELVGGEGRYAIVLTHSTGRKRTVDRLGVEFIAYLRMAHLRNHGFNVRVVDRAETAA